MITSVELGNFISHSETKLDFESGVTVFVGQNGAGKSSIIDAITFALFGKHTRKSNKSLIRRGTSQAYAKINFSAGGKNYLATRKIDAKGTLSAQFYEIKDGQQLPLASGERKQFGESMTEHVISKLGLDFEKLKIASIVQQGELGAIIKARPKEFKELLNAIIGIDQLDVASENLKVVKNNFRQSIQQRLGYDDTDIDILKKELKQIEQESKEVLPQQEELQKRKELQEKELTTLEQKIKMGSQKEAILEQVEQRKQELRKYVKDAITSIKNEIIENERKIAECHGCFEMAAKRMELESTLQNIENEIENITKKILELEKQQAVLQEHHELAKKLQLHDGRCPVCDSKVNQLTPLFQIEHITSERQKITRDLSALFSKRQQALKEKNELSLRLQKARDAQTILRAHAIQRPEQLDALRSQVEARRAQIQNTPTAEGPVILTQAASIDSHAKLLYESIEEMQKEISDFDQSTFNKLKLEREQKRKEISRIDQQYGAITEKIKHASQRIEKINSILCELDLVRDYLEHLDGIQANVYGRDGPVATSLRSWALSTISAKSSEYLEMLNTKIHRISLAEKTRDVTITCYSKNAAVDIDSLSGGEQVTVALALRLGMAHLLGASNLNFVILDEPTTHLDAERRRALVRVISQLSEISDNTSGPLQFIIITHDSEIFEDSTVERIYRFEASPTGTVVTPL